MNANHLTALSLALLLTLGPACIAGEEREPEEREQPESRAEQRERGDQPEEREWRERVEREHAERRRNLERERPDRQFEEVAGFIKANLPGVYEELMRLREQAGDTFRAEMREWSEVAREFHHIREESAEEAEEFLRELRRDSETRQLAKHIAGTDNAEQRERLTAELRKQLGETFEARMKDLRTEAEALAEELEHVRHTIEKREKARERMITHHLHELLLEAGDEDAEALEW